MRSLATQRAPPTRPVVTVRSIATQPAAATRPRVLMRSIATPRATTTRPSVLTPSYSTQSALLTQVSVLWRSSPTQPAATTWPSATGWLATPPARPTQLLVLVHSATTPSAAATSQWAFLPPVILPLAIITSTSAILVWQRVQNYPDWYETNSQGHIYRRHQLGNRSNRCSSYRRWQWSSRHDHILCAFQGSD